MSKDSGITKEELEQKYIEEHLSIRKIAQQLGCSSHKVKSLLQQYNIPVRSNRIPDIEPEMLYALYIEQAKTSKEIADELGCSANFVIKQLHKHGITTRAKSCQDKISKLNKETLYKLYIDEKKSSREIASAYDINKRTVLILLDNFGIEKRHHKEYNDIDSMSQKDKNKMRDAFVIDRVSLKELSLQYNVFINNLLRFAEVEKWKEARYAYEMKLVSEQIHGSSKISYSQIKKTTGLPKNVVKRCCEELHYEHRSKKVEKLDHNAIICAYCDKHMSVQNIADTNDVSYSTIYNILKKQGVLRSPQDYMISIDPDVLYQRYVIDRATYAELCEEFNVSPISLNRILKRNNIELIRSVKHKDEWDDFAAFVKQMFKQRQEKIGIIELAHYFDVTPASVRGKIRENNLQQYVEVYRSYAEQQWEKWLHEQNIEFKSHDRNIIAPQEIDIILEPYGIGIEINPTVTHNSDVDVYGGEPKKTTYHQHKARAAEQAGINLISVFDWHDEDKLKNIILGLCQRNEKIFARRTFVNQLDVSTEREFLEKYHLQGYISSKYAYGLYDHRSGELLAVMSFKEPRYDNKEQAEWELLRFCTKAGINVIGGASKLFCAFVREHNPSSVMSFANMDISNGNVYEKMGFSFVRYTSPSYQWVKLNDPSEHYSWNLVKQMGFDKLFGTNYGKGTSNTALMLENGFVRVFNSGNKVYVWQSSS